MTKEEKNEVFKKLLDNFPKGYGRLTFRDHLILRIAFDAGLKELEKENAELKKKNKEYQQEIQGLYLSL